MILKFLSEAEDELIEAYIGVIFFCQAPNFIDEKNGNMLTPIFIKPRRNAKKII